MFACVVKPTAFQQFMLRMNTGLDHSDDTQPATDVELMALGLQPVLKSALPWWMAPQDTCLNLIVTPGTCIGHLTMLYHSMVPRCK